MFSLCHQFLFCYLIRESILNIVTFTKYYLVLKDWYVLYQLRIW